MAMSEPAKMRRKALALARKTVEQKFADSEIADNTDLLPHFEFGDLQLGEILGKGSFGTVAAVESFACHEEISVSSEDYPEESTSSDPIMASYCVREGGEIRYAVKFLSPNIVQDPALLYEGVMDMAVESRILSDIVHPHIIKLRAVAYASSFNENYFIVMDRLYDTLERRIKKWSLLHTQISTNDETGAKTKKLYKMRIKVAHALASAVDYLHERDIVYRDIKPENVGFDIRDDVKLFDFGLAKELHERDCNDDGTYNLTFNTGSPRYMAPEVALSQPYNQECDAYSFAIMLWQMMSFEMPYALETLETLQSDVWAGALRRPPIADEWPETIKLLLKHSWEPNLQLRNDVGLIKEMLQEELNSL